MRGWMIRRQLAATNFVNSRIRFLHLRDEGLLKVYRVQKWRRLLFWNQIFPLTLYSRMNMLIRYTYLITFAVSSLECFIHIKSNNKYSTVYTLYYGVLSHYVKYIFCENSDVRGFIWSSSALHNFLRYHVFRTYPSSKPSRVWKMVRRLAFKFLSKFHQI